MENSVYDIIKDLEKLNDKRFDIENGKKVDYILGEYIRFEDLQKVIDYIIKHNW